MLNNNVMSQDVPELGYKVTIPKCLLYRVFQRFRQVKFDNGGSILSASQFLLLPQLPKKMKLASKVVKIDSE